MKIIRLNHDDFELWSSQIEELINCSVRINFPGAEAGKNYGKDKCAEIARFLEAGSAVVFAAIDEKELAGYVWCHEIQRLYGKRIHISEIAVADDHQRQGIGGRLLAEVERYAKENGYQAIDLLVTACNTDAVRFYENTDFRPERYLMKKTISKNVQAGESTDA